MAQLTRRTDDAGAVRAQAVRFPDQTEFDGVPVQARQQLARAQVMCLEATLAIALHVVGEHRVEQQRYMAEQVVEDVGLHDVVELFGRADPVGDREAPVGQQVEERPLGDQSRHGHDLPAGGGSQALVDLIESRDAVAHTKRGQGVDESLRSKARQQGALALVEPAIRVVVGLGVGRPVLWAGVVLAGARVVAARRALA